MTRDVRVLGLGARLADPVSIWPEVTVIEINPDVAAGIGDRPSETVREAIAASAGVDVERLGDVTVTITEHGSALVRVPSRSDAAQALQVAARRRASSPAEALHAALLGLD